MNQLWDEPYHVVIEIENERCKVVEGLKTGGIPEFKITDVRGLRGGLTRHLVELSQEHIDKISDSSLVKMERRRKFKGRTLVWFESEGCDLCNTILSHGSFLISAKNIQGLTFIYSFIVPNFDAFRSIISVLESGNFNLEILKLEKYKLEGKVLTEKQERVLWLALKMGFFDYPKKIGTKEFSRKLGISPSTLSEILRRGMRRLLEYHFKT